MAGYKCHSSSLKEDVFSDIIHHTITQHPDNELVIRKKMLSSLTGTMGYLSKRFKGIIPADVLEDGRTIVADDTPF